MQKEYIKYDKALTDNEILTFAQIVDQFKNRDIDYRTLKSMFLNNGVNVDPILRERQMMTISEAAALDEKKSNDSYEYDDISQFVLNGKGFENVAFCIDSKAIEVLANNGYPEYQSSLISMLSTQLRYSYDKDEDWKIERAKWKRRIVELETELSKTNQIGRIF